jgi:flagellar hook-basal body complex protein FliE
MRITAIDSAGAASRQVGALRQASGPGVASRDPARAPAAEPTKGDFAAALRRSVSGLVDLQTAADRAVEAAITGDLTNLHEAVVAMQRASLAIEFASAVRNHVVDGIEELLRTQV